MSGEVGFKVGEGTRGKLSEDEWLGVGPLPLLYPRIFREVSQIRVINQRLFCFILG